MASERPQVLEAMVSDSQAQQELQWRYWSPGEEEVEVTEEGLRKLLKNRILEPTDWVRHIDDPDGCQVSNFSMVWQSSAAERIPASDAGQKRRILARVSPDMWMGVVLVGLALLAATAFVVLREKPSPEGEQQVARAGEEKETDTGLVGEGVGIDGPGLEPEESDKPQLEDELRSQVIEASATLDQARPRNPADSAIGEREVPSSSGSMGQPPRPVIEAETGALDNVPTPSKEVRYTNSPIAAKLSEILVGASTAKGLSLWPYTYLSFEVARELESPLVWHRSQLPEGAQALLPDDVFAGIYRTALVGGETLLEDIVKVERSGNHMSPDELLALAHWHISAGTFSKAHPLLEGLVLQDGAPPLAHAYLALCEEGERPTAEVLGRAIRTCEQDPFDTTGIAILGAIANRAGDVDTVDLCMRWIAEVGYWSPGAEALAQVVMQEGPNGVFYSADGKNFKGWGHNTGSSGPSGIDHRVVALSGDGSVLAGWTEFKVALVGSVNASPAYWGASWTGARLAEGKLTKGAESVRALSLDGRQSIVRVQAGLQSTDILWDREEALEEFPLRDTKVELDVAGLGLVEAKVLEVACNAMSDEGQLVVGTFKLQLENRRAFLASFMWTVREEAELLPILNGSTGSTAEGVSPNGEWIVGTVSGRACRWRSTGDDSPMLLGQAGDEIGSVASAVSNDGRTIVGHLSVVSGRVRGTSSFVWTESGGMIALKDLSDHVSDSGLLDVSADGSIAVGWGRPARGQRAIIWTATGGVQEVQNWAYGMGLDIDEERFGWALHDAQGISTDGMVLAGTGLVGRASRPWSLNLRASAGVVGLLTLKGGK